MKTSNVVSLALLVAGLSFWTLAPYGGCSCNNPMGPSSGPSPTPSPTQGPKIDDWEDGNFVNYWGGSASSAFDTYAGSSGGALNLSTGSTLPGGTSGRGLRLSGTIAKDGPPNYPYAQAILSLGSTRNMLTTFGGYNGLQFSYVWSSSLTVTPGVSFFVVAGTPQTVTDFGWWRYQIAPSDNNWHMVQIYFPNKAGAPKFAQPTWAATRDWAGPTYFSGSKVDNFQFSVQPVTGSPSQYDLTVDDVTLF